MATVKDQIIGYVNSTTAYFVNIVPADTAGVHKYFAAGLSNSAYGIGASGSTIIAPAAGNFNVYASCEHGSSGCSTDNYANAMSGIAGFTTTNIKSITSTDDTNLIVYYNSIPLSSLSATIDALTGKMFAGNKGGGNVTVNIPVSSANLPTGGVANSTNTGFDWSALTPYKFKYDDLVGKESFRYPYLEKREQKQGGVSFGMNALLVILIVLFIALALYYLIQNC